MLFIVVTMIISLSKTQAQDSNILLGLDDPAYGVQIRTNWPGATLGWARGFSIVNQNATERFITLGSKGQSDNGISTLHYSWIGKDFDDTYMSFLPNGNIGIGTNAPQNSLSLVFNEDNTTLGTNVKSAIRISNQFATSFGRRSEIQFGLDQNSNSNLAVIASEYASWDGAPAGDLIFGTSPTSSTDILERMRVKHNGNVGIGTNDPKSKLHVEGKASFGKWGVLHADWTNEANWGGASNLWAGYIGFNAYRNNDDEKDMYYGTNPYTAKAAFEGSNAGFRWMYRKRINDDSENQHTLNEYMRLTRDGSLALGTVNPGTSKLAIAGDVSVGASGNASLFARHINGKKSDSFNADDLYLNYGTGHDVFIGNETVSGSDLFVMNGNVGIATTSTGNHKLAVEGSIGAREIKVEIGAWSDFVFEKEYNLPTLEEVESHIAEKGHLENIPSAIEVEKNGIFLGEMNAKLLQKIEELTLYTIAQEKKIKALESQNTRIEKLEKENDELKNLFSEFKALKASIEALKK